MAAGRRHAKHSPVDYILLFVTPISINFAKFLLVSKRLLVHLSHLILVDKHLSTKRRQRALVQWNFAKVVHSSMLYARLEVLRMLECVSNGNSVTF